MVENNNDYERNEAVDESCEDSADQSVNDSVDNTAESTENTETSYFYVPPYYIPNSSNGWFEQTKPKKSKKNILKVAAVSVIVACLAVIIALLLGCMALMGVFVLRLDIPDRVEQQQQQQNQQIDIENEELLIVQNSPKIELSQSTDPNYVPQSIPEVVQKVGASVVEISTSQVVNDRFFHQYVTSGAGSGVIITQSEKAGYLLTNHHVIDSADEIVVRLTNGEEYAATVLGSDAEMDLAVLRIVKKKSETFTTAPIGNSSNLVVGQDVIAIGNPLGSLGGTVTDGIISALDRTVVIDNISMVLLQHNAAINPGNSGGGLFDGMGNLIGIVNAKTSETGIEGLGFAIPVDIAYAYFNRVILVEPAMGVKVSYGSLNRVAGLYVTDIVDGNNNFKKYDRIVAVNGKAVKTSVDYTKEIANLKSGDTVTLSVKRDNRDLEVKVVLK